MPLANLVSRKLRIFIGADQQDWSACWGAFAPGWSSLDESGLLKISATLTLFQNLLSPESINSRENPTRWRPGQPVLVQIQNSGGTWVTHPVGNLILLSEPDLPQGGAITLNLGCWLAWVDTFEFDDDQSGVTLGAAQNCAEVAARLLEANEIPPGQIDLGPWEYELAYPASKTSGGSFAGQAGELAYSNNWRYLYQDSDGIIRSRSLSTLPGAPVVTITLGQNDALFSPLRDPQAPVELVKVAGVGYDIGQRQNGNSDVTVATGPASDVSPVCSGTATLLRETVTENWDIPSDLGQDIVFTTTATIEELRGAVWVDVSSSPCSLVAWKRTRETKRYPQSGADALRLKTHTVEVDQREGTLLASGTPLNWRTTKDTTVSYTYSTSEAISRIETLERVAEITVDKESDNPFQLRIARKEILEWEEIEPQNWKQKERFEIARIVEDSAVDKFNGNPWARRTTTRTPQSDTGSTQPPRTELWTGVATQKERHYEGTATWTHPGGSTGRTRKRLYTVPFGFSNQQCALLAGLHRDLLVGRHYGYEIELPISDALLTAGPLFQVNVVDGSTTYRLLADSASWGHTETRASVYCTAILLDSYTGLEPVYAGHGVVAPVAEVGAAVDVAVGAELGVIAPVSLFGAELQVQEAAITATLGVTAPVAEVGAVATVSVEANLGVVAPVAEFGATVSVLGNWVLSGGAWSDDGEWDDGATWEDS